MFVTPGTPAIRRADQKIQFGTDRTGIIISDLSEAQIEFAMKWANSGERLTNKFIHKAKLSNPEAREVVKKLNQAGLLVSEKTASPAALCLQRIHGSARALEALGDSVVRIQGLKAFGAKLAHTLAENGVETFELVDPNPVNTTDTIYYPLETIDQPRAQALAKTLPAKCILPNNRRADKRIHVGIFDYAIDPVWALQQVQKDWTSLPVIVRENEIEVGPLLNPGHTLCSRCLYLNQCEEDAEWPNLYSQLLQLQAPTPVPLLNQGVSAFTAYEIINYLCGLPIRLNHHSWTFSYSDPVPMLRRWLPHAECGCELSKLPLREQLGDTVPKPFEYFGIASYS